MRIATIAGTDKHTVIENEAEYGKANYYRSKSNSTIHHLRQVSISDRFAVVNITRAPLEINKAAVVAQFTSNFQATISIVWIIVVHKLDFRNCFHDGKLADEDS